MQEGFFSHTGNRVLASLSLFMLLLALGSYAMLNLAKVQYANPMPATVTVSGEGEVFAVPDVGQFSFSVTAEGTTASEAQEASGTKINDILAYLEEQGIEEKDIKTQNYNLYPRYRYEERICPAGSYCPPGERVQDGFEVNQTIAVKVRDTAEAPSIISGVGERGATNISGLNFTVDDTDALRAEARSQAISDAREKATALAEQLGVRVVRIMSYYEEGNYYEPYARAMSFDAAAEGMGGFGGAELPMGEDSTAVRVNVTFVVE